MNSEKKEKNLPVKMHEPIKSIQNRSEGANNPEESQYYTFQDEDDQFEKNLR